MLHSPERRRTGDFKERIIFHVAINCNKDILMATRQITKDGFLDWNKEGVITIR